MPLVGTRELFKKAHDGGCAVGAFNVNNCPWKTELLGEKHALKNT